ncbi:MAG: hypothetical protein JWM30_1112, partial [Burkholderia sp.]|nr:hypothetical protein [Burkholderia sp.]
MHDFDVIEVLRRKVGSEFPYEKEGESVVGLALTSKGYIFSGLIRHHSRQEKHEILM